MKDTPITNEYVKVINDCIAELNSYTNYEDEPFVCMYPNEYADEIDASINKLKEVDVDIVKAEFVDTLEDYGKVFFQKKLFEFKFERLLNWKHDYENGFEENGNKFNTEFIEFVNCQVSYQIDVRSVEFNRLRGLYMTLSARVTLLKYQIKTMLAHYDELGKIYLQTNNLKVVSFEEEITRKRIQPGNCIKVTVASKRKTDIIKILSAMYDARMFAGEDGKPLTNKQNLMDAFGEFLGDDFSAYSTLLSQAKDKDVDTFMKPLTELEKAFRNYLNFTTKE